MWQMRELSQGDYDQKTIYNENPLEVAKEFEDTALSVCIW